MKKLRKSSLAVLIVGLFATVVFSPAYAQQPQPTATATPANLSGLPEITPPGWNQDIWDRTRAQCNELAAKGRAHQAITEREQSVAAGCRALNLNFNYPQQGAAPGSYQSSEYPTPAPITVTTPTPQSGLQGFTIPQSVLSAVGPSGLSFPGGGEDACANGSQQPPDVSADVSSTQAVEFLNGSGLYVFDKSGSLQAGYPISQAIFWSTNNPGTNQLTDTQIAFEPLGQRWLATVMSVTAAQDNGDLYFAFTANSSATGWNSYKFPNICSTGQPMFPFPDQPIVGYNQAWIAIDLQCFTSGNASGSASSLDQLVLIPHSVLMLATPPTSLACGQPIVPNGPSVICKSPPFFGARPSRDVAADGTKNLFLVGSVVDISGHVQSKVQVTTVDASGNFIGPSPSGGILLSPGNGNNAAPLTLAPQGTCDATSTCEIRLGDSRIENVVLQKGNDGNHYLLSSFHTGSFPRNVAQALYFIGQVESFATSAPKWNTTSVLSGPNTWIAYPTISMDDDLDVAVAYTTFSANSFISPAWAMSKGFASDGTWGALLGRVS
jgi:hypothetical protein